MGSIGFQQWADGGCYGGLVCSLLAAACLAAYALFRRRGTSRQFSRAVLICLAASCLMLVPVWWDLNRFAVLGPTISTGEVLFWLVWVAVIGWCVPIGTLASYVTLAAPQEAPTRRSTGHNSGPTLERILNDPARHIEPLGAGQAWAQLIPLEAMSSLPEHPLALTRQANVIGREADNDIMLDDKRASRHHVELRWDHGRVQLRDLGSMNGTFVNQQAVQGPVILKTGDIVEIGAQRFRFEQLATTSALANASVLVEETRKMAGTGRPAGQPTPRLLPALKLLALNGKAVGAEWDVRGAVMILGRDQECDVCLPDNSVSRKHAQIIRQLDGYFLSDLQSRNGTSLNDIPLSSPAPIRAGDLLRLGEIVLRCEAASSSSQTTQAMQPHSGPPHTGGIRTEPPEVRFLPTEDNESAPQDEAQGA